MSKKKDEETEADRALTFGGRLTAIREGLGVDRAAMDREVLGFPHPSRHRWRNLELKDQGGPEDLALVLSGLLRVAKKLDTDKPEKLAEQLEAFVRGRGALPTLPPWTDGKPVRAPGRRHGSRFEVRPLGAPAAAPGAAPRLLPAPVEAPATDGRSDQAVDEILALVASHGLTPESAKPILRLLILGGGGATGAASGRPASSGKPSCPSKMETNTTGDSSSLAERQAALRRIVGAVSADEFTVLLDNLKHFDPPVMQIIKDGYSRYSKVRVDDQHARLRPS